MYKLGRKVFISYRTHSWGDVEALAYHLKEQGLCEEVVCFPPKQVCDADELLMPFEYVELMEFILDVMARSDAFICFDKGDYWSSFWTQMEVFQWRRFKDNPVVHTVTGDAHRGFALVDQRTWPTLSDNQKKLWAKISVGVNRGMQHHMSPAFATGKYAKSCYLIPCRTCGEYFLVSRKFVDKVLKGEELLQCPNASCWNRQFQIATRSHMGLYYRKPIILQQPARGPVRILEPDEILRLLMLNELPDRVRVVPLSGERFRSDMEVMVKTTLGIAVVGAAAALAFSFFSGDKRRDESSEE